MCALSIKRGESLFRGVPPIIMPHVVRVEVASEVVDVDTT